MGHLVRLVVRGLLTGLVITIGFPLVVGATFHAHYGFDYVASLIGFAAVLAIVAHLLEWCIGKVVPRHFSLISMVASYIAASLVLLGVLNHYYPGHLEVASGRNAFIASLMLVIVHIVTSSPDSIKPKSGGGGW